MPNENKGLPNNEFPKYAHFDLKHIVHDQLNHVLLAESPIGLSIGTFCFLTDGR